MDHPPTAPPVVVVVVARDPGPWFEESLEALDHQDYPNLSVLVVDADSQVDPSPLVAAALPSAYVRRVETPHGFAGAANDALDTVKGAAFLIFCHDDVALEPDAVRRLVEEAMRSNAGIVGPKVVDWDRPERLLDVGLAVDKTGASATLAERGELDQEQHDAVRDVFAVSSTCMLVRGDLFETMAGFDMDMTDHGSDVDFCWRAQVAGARVLVAPAALARHRMAAGSGDDDDVSTSFLAHRNHLRSMLKNYTLLHLIRVVPQAAVLLIGEVAFALAKRRFAEARELLGAWWWNVRSLPGLRGARREVGEARAVPDSEVRRLQVRGSVRLNQYLQRQFRAEERAQALLSAGQQLVGSVGKGPAQVAAVLLAILTLTWLVGMRSLLGGHIPGVAELAPLPGTSTLMANWISGWRATGMGIAGAAPTAFGLLGLSSFVLLGKTVLLHKLIVLGVWPLAAVGVWRLTRPFSSGLARIVGVIVYASLPLSYNSLARGRLGALVAYAALPWLFGALVRATGLQPWAGDEDDGAGSGFGDAHRWRASVLGLGLGLAVTTALAPPTALVFLLVAAGITLGSLLVGGIGGSIRALGVGASATGVAAVLLMPWVLELVIPSGGWATAAGVAPHPSMAPSLGALMRFEVGPLGAAPLGWAVLAAAAFPVLLGKGWRFEWAVRLWAVAIVCWLAAWAGARGWLPVQLESPHELLVPAALALALAAAMGAAAFDLDLRAYRFGWRQVASVTAALAVTVGVIPVLAGAGDGRFHLTGNDTARTLSWMDETASDGAFRVLWVGAPEALPLDGWSLGDGLAFATSRDGVPTFVDRFPGRASGATKAIAEVLRDAENGDTAQLGHLLAPMAIRYVVLPLDLDADAGRSSSSGSTGAGGTRPSGGAAAGDAAEFPLPESLTRALASQIDLRLRPASAALTVYENTAWGPGRGLLGGSLPVDAADDDIGGGADLSTNSAVLLSSRANRYRGEITTAGRIFVSESPSPRWSLTIDGRGSSRTSAFGTANVFETTRVGAGLLRYRTPFVYSLLLAVQVALWCLAVRALLRMRRQSRAGMLR